MKILLFKLGKRILLLGLFIFLVIGFSSRMIASFLQITSTSFIVIAGFIMFLSILLPLLYGGLQGFQKFTFLGINMILIGVVKLLLGIFLISIGFEIIGVFIAVVVSTFLALFLSLIMLRAVLNTTAVAVSSVNPVSSSKETRREEKFNLSKVYKYFIPVSIAFFCFMALTNMDVILVKHFFSPLKAGYYSIAQMIGKIILFLPVAISMVMFTKTSHFHARNRDTIPMVKKTLIIIGLICGGVALICIFFPSVIIKAISGKEHLECFPLARLFAVAMTFFALTHTLLLYYLSIHRYDFIRPLVFFTILQIVLICFFHRTLSQVLYILSGNAFLLFVINLRWLKKPAKSAG